MKLKLRWLWQVVAFHSLVVARKMNKKTAKLGKPDIELPGGVLLQIPVFLLHSACCRW